MFSVHHERAQALQALLLHLLAADGEHFIDGAVTHDLAHDGLGEIAQGGERFAEVERVGHRVFNVVLHLPLDEHGVQVAGDHVFLLLLLFVLGVLVKIRGPLCGGAELELLLALHLDERGGVDAPGQLEVQAGRHGLQVTAKRCNTATEFAGTW
jgi:hypothetical protein